MREVGGITQDLHRVLLFECGVDGHQAVTAAAALAPTARCRGRALDGRHGRRRSGVGPTRQRRDEDRLAIEREHLCLPPRPVTTAHELVLDVRRGRGEPTRPLSTALRKPPLQALFPTKAVRSCFEAKVPPSATSASASSMSRSGTTSLLKPPLPSLRVRVIRTIAE